VPAAKDEEYGAEPLGEDDPYDPCTNTDRGITFYNLILINYSCIYILTLSIGHGTHVAGIIAGYDPEKVKQPKH
jgi:subtilisin family serine protease